MPSAAQRPEDVGILAMAVEVPHQYVEQADLEALDGVSAGKYTSGLGQVLPGLAKSQPQLHTTTPGSSCAGPDGLLQRQRGRRQPGLDCAGPTGGDVWPGPAPHRQAGPSQQRALGCEQQSAGPACRLEVGSESGIDHSKSVKSFLMQRFEAVGNTDVLASPQAAGAAALLRLDLQTRLSAGHRLRERLLWGHSSSAERCGLGGEQRLGRPASHCGGR